ncbi:hypothetical protein [Helicobacter fennelliae]|uniref:Uncharacterized protein n=1 Tax=Helicobacter fennelliae MRY12-0050 TaxID=1325130 RepID=T1CYQ2_9HELI|nr:hypothetical protein [Helicobacter fennelliae]GAD18086.1 hypothetical protein HFN_1684 [Helicobacter fennelliae MRY12-0050]
MQTQKERKRDFKMSLQELARVCKSLIDCAVLSKEIRLVAYRRSEKQTRSSNRLKARI